MQHLFKYLLFSLLLSPSLAFSQAHLVLNDDVFVNIDNGAYLVIDNPDSAAIKTSGTGGHILTERIENRIKWNIGNKMGSYDIPLSNSHIVNNVATFTKIPLKINITSSGDSNGYFLIATIPTNEVNLYEGAYPLGISNLCSSLAAGGSINAALQVMDRFWILDNSSYVNKPSALLSFGYDYPNEGTGSNNITIGNLQAQRFNPSVSSSNSCNDTNALSTANGSWENLSFGVDNTNNATVANCVVPSNEFFTVWALVDQVSPLPIKDYSFAANCLDEGSVGLSWVAASNETTNYKGFELYKSIDGKEWTLLTELSGKQDNEEPYYYYKDLSNVGQQFYKLVVINADNGRYTAGPISANCRNLNAPTWKIFPIPAKDEANISVNAIQSADVTLKVSDAQGRVIHQQGIRLENGNNHFIINTSQYASGLYFISLVGKSYYKTLKMVKQ